MLSHQNYIYHKQYDDSTVPPPSAYIFFKQLCLLSIFGLHHGAFHIHRRSCTCGRGGDVGPGRAAGDAARRRGDHVPLAAGGWGAAGVAGQRREEHREAAGGGEAADADGISKDRELMRRLSGSDVPKRTDKIKPNPEDYIHEYGLKMDIDEDKKTPPTRQSGTTAASGSSTAPTEAEPSHIMQGGSTARKLEFDELITEEEMNKLRGARLADAARRPPDAGLAGAASASSAQPDWTVAMQSMFDKQADRMEYMFKGMDARMNGLEDDGQHGAGTTTDARGGSLLQARHIQEQR